MPGDCHAPPTGPIRSPHARGRGLHGLRRRAVAVAGQGGGAARRPARGSGRRDHRRPVPVSPGLGPGEPRGGRRRAGPGGAAARRATPAAHRGRRPGPAGQGAPGAGPADAGGAQAPGERQQPREPQARRPDRGSAAARRCRCGRLSGDDRRREADSAGRRCARERRDLAGAEPGPRHRLVRRRAAPPRPHGARRRGAHGHDQDRDRSRLRRRRGPRGLRRGRRQPGGARPQGP